MSWSLRASILIALESQRGNLCTLGWIAGRVVAPVRLIEPLCAELVLAGLVQDGVGPDGAAVFGVEISQSEPALIDVASETAP